MKCEVCLSKCCRKSVELKEQTRTYPRLPVHLPLQIPEPINPPEDIRNRLQLRFQESLVPGATYRRYGDILYHIRWPFHLDL